MSVEKKFLHKINLEMNNTLKIKNICSNDFLSNIKIEGLCNIFARYMVKLNSRLHTSAVDLNRLVN